jgi:hypothetical protein
MQAEREAFVSNAVIRNCYCCFNPPARTFMRAPAPCAIGAAGQNSK